MPATTSLPCGTLGRTSYVCPTQSIGWASMALPLVACVAIWGIGNASPASMTWLPTLHKLIAMCAFAWTALRFIGRSLRSPSPQFPAPLPARAGLLTLYALLALQPALALTGSMLRGHATTLFGVAVPSILPVDPSLALRIDHLHAWNALLLLALISMHVVAELRRVRHRASHP
jgi:cytochrome b561